MKKAADDNKNMEYAVHPMNFWTNAVYDRSDGIADPAAKQKHKTGVTQGVHCLRNERSDGPSHSNIADHGEYIILFQINGSQCGS